MTETPSWFYYQTDTDVLRSPARRVLATRLSVLHGGAAIPAAQDAYLQRLQMLEGWDRLPGEIRRCARSFNRLAEQLRMLSPVLEERSVVDDIVEWEP